MKKKFSESTLLESARKSITTPSGRVFKGVTLIKSGMGNRRDKNYYPPEALKEGVAQGLFEGLRAFADHPDSVSEEIQPERSIRDMVGVYENAEYDEGKQAVTADLRILKSHSWLSEAIDELIDVGHADKIGLSINGRGETEPTRRHLEEAGGEVEVNELKRFIELRSTDVVTEAGAGGGFAQLVESARRAKVQESATMKPKMSTVLAQLREAARQGKKDEVAKLTKALDTAENDLGEAEDGDEGEPKARKTKEMGAFGNKSKKRTFEAKSEEVEEAEDGDEPDEADDEAALDEAADQLRDGDDADLDEASDDDLEEGDDDLEEGDDEADDEDGDETQEAEDGDAPALKARAKFAKAREAAIKGGLGPKTGSVTSGAGRFTTRARSAGGGKKRMSTTSTMGFKKGRRPGSARAREANVGALVESNRRLREQIARQDSINLATKMLRESNLPRAVRPHVLRDLIGLTKAEMQAEINKQASILEAAAASAVERLSDDFDPVEGAGATTLREGYFGGRSRDDGDGLGDILAECGLPMKRG